MRLFFALWPDADAARRLSQVAALWQLPSPGRLVQPRNYHVTLAFMGEVANSQLAKWQQIGAALRAPRCRISLSMLAYWPRSQALVAVAQEHPPVLVSLWTQLHDAAHLPQSTWRAHATLARKVVQPPVLQAMSPIIWLATAVKLVRSDTVGAESAYTVLDTWPLLYED